MGVFTLATIYAVTRNTPENVRGWLAWLTIAVLWPLFWFIGGIIILIKGYGKDRNI